jgi:hypothetical protein
MKKKYFLKMHSAFIKLLLIQSIYLAFGWYTNQLWLHKFPASAVNLIWLISSYRLSTFVIITEHYNGESKDDVYSICAISPMGYICLFIGSVNQSHKKLWPFIVYVHIKYLSMPSDLWLIFHLFKARSIKNS